MTKKNGTNKSVKLKLPCLHTEVDSFRAALEFTARATGFRMDLIEKDFYCSLVLDYLYANFQGSLIFKGGTCLNKVHVGFYRLSEDLDFTIPTSSKSTRNNRKSAVTPLKVIVDHIKKGLPGFEIKEPLKGSNESRQYNAEVQYRSISEQLATIKIEVGLRETLISEPLNGKASTLLQDPFTAAPAVPSLEVQCLTQFEAYAEKMRAALTRRHPAIRDYFDIDHAAHLLKFNFKNALFLEMVSKKLRVPGTGPVCDKTTTQNALRTQLETELRPVLRENDFKNFSLDRAIQLIYESAALLKC